MAGEGWAELNHPNVERGIKPEKIYDVLGIDTINPYNGNMMLNLPLGLPKANGGPTQYGLTLVYNSRVLDYRLELQDANNPACPNFTSYQYQMLTRHSDVGVGWNVSLGRLISPDDPLNDYMLLDTSVVPHMGEDLCYPSDKAAGFSFPAGYPGTERDPYNRIQWVYEGPDGGDHTFKDVQNCGDVSYTQDGSRLRMRVDASDRSIRYIDFPDGSTHTFQRFKNGPRTLWRLMSIHDSFDNTLTISYDSAIDLFSNWSIKDQFNRFTRIYYTTADTRSADLWYRRVLDRVEMGAADGGTLTWKFNYGYPDEMSGYTTGRIDPLLTSVVPQGSSSGLPSYSFEYEPNSAELSAMILPTGGRIEWGYGSFVRSSGNCNGTIIQTVRGVKTRTLRADKNATQAQVWTYQQGLNWKLKCSMCEGGEMKQPETCVLINPLLETLDSVDRRFKDVIKGTPRPEALTVLTSPDGNKVVHYFNVLSQDASCTDITGPQLYTAAEIGQPFTRRAITAGSPNDDAPMWAKPDGTATASGPPEPANPINRGDAQHPDNLYLSTVSYSCAPGALPGAGFDQCKPERATYVRYESDNNAPGDLPPWGFLDDPIANPRVQAERTVYFTQQSVTGTQEWVDSDNSSYVPGHYQTTKTTGSFEPYVVDGNAIYKSRTSTTVYVPIDTSTQYLLNNYTSTTTTESNQTATTSDDPFATTLTVFDSKGFLTGKRVIRSLTGNAAQYDVIAHFTRDSAGNLTQEDWGLADDASPDANSSYTKDYSAVYTYQLGIPVTSQYVPTQRHTFLGLSNPQQFFVNRITLESNTGLPLTSTDPAGVVTSFSYDSLGRLKTDQRGNSKNTYNYRVKLNASTPAWVETIQIDTSDITGTELTHSGVEYDEFGRIHRQWQNMDNIVSVRDTTYDPVTGLKVSVSEAGGNAPSTYKTVFGPYDPFGRVLQVVAPDGNVTTFDYHHGVHLLDKTVGIGRSRQGDTVTNVPTTTKQISDPFGRLVSVVEEGDLATNYTYDVGNRLSLVESWNFERRTSGIEQRRRFIYDAAGFLLHEEHPELTTTGVQATENATEGVHYSGYDSKGHVGEKVIGSSGSGFHLKFEYDAAERLRKVSDQSAPFTPYIQEFEYDELANDPGHTIGNQFGRLLKSTRHNMFGGVDYAVSDYFTYDNAGRTSTKETVLTDPDTPANTKSFKQTFDYNALDLVTSAKYPECDNCGAPPVRSVGNTYSHGLLTSVVGFTSPTDPIRYATSGIVTSIHHVSKNGDSLVTETHTPDDHDMARLKEIKFEGAKACSEITQQPSDQVINPGAPASFSVAAQGEDLTDKDLTYQWYVGQAGDTSNPISGATNKTYTTPALTATTQYWVQVNDTSHTCPTNSVTATARLCQPAAIQRQPYAALTISTSGELSVEASGDGITYQWQKLESGNWTDQPSGRSRVLPVTTAGSYRVIINGTCGNAQTSQTAVVTVVTCTPASIVYNLPTATMVPISSIPVPIKITMAPLGANESYTYVWHHARPYGADDTLPGHTESEDKTTSQLYVTAQTWDIFWVTVTKTCDGGVQSTVTSARTHVWPVGTCPLPPLTVDQSIINLDTPNANMTFTASLDWPSVTYQWYRGETGNTSSPISAGAGGTADHLTVNPVIGNYWVRATSHCGTFKDSGTLVVQITNCGPLHLTVPPAMAPPHPEGVLAGSAVGLTVDAAGMPSPAVWNWFEGTGVNAHSVGTERNITVFPIQTTSYWVSIRNDCSTYDTQPVTVHVTSCAAINLASVSPSISISEGASTTLSVDANAAQQLVYQWYQGESGDTSQPLAGQTGSAMVVTPATSTKYWARIGFGQAGLCAIDTATITVSVCHPLQLLGSVNHQYPVVDGQAVWLGAKVDAENVTYQWFKGEIDDETSPVEPASASGTTLVVAHETAHYWVKVISHCLPPQGDQVLKDGPYILAMRPGISEQPQSVTIMLGTTTTLSVTATGQVTKYEWYAGASGTVGPVLGTSATFTTPAVSAETQFWVRVYSEFMYVDSDAATVFMCNNVSVTWGGAEQQVTKGKHQFVNVFYLPAVDTNVTYYEGPVGNVAGSHVIAGPTPNAGVDLTTTATTTYWARAKNGPVCYADSAPLTITVCIPTITTQPVSSMINAGDTAHLSVVADITPVTYQWYTGASGDTSNPISGATSDTLDVTPSSATSYWVAVTGSCSIVTKSTAANITICATPQQQTPLAHPVIAAGQSTALTMNATGTGLTYHWYSGAVGVTDNPIGTNSPTVVVTPSSTTDYWVHVTGACGTAIDASTTVSVPPVITLQPVSANVTKGSIREMLVSATGNRLTYEWFQGAAGDTSHRVSTSIAFPTPPINATTQYWVRVHSGEASVDSDVATLAVCPGPAATSADNTGVSGAFCHLSIVNGDQQTTTYQWYRGNPGDTSNPAGGGVLVTINPTVTTTYWVRSTTSECSADSDPVVVAICIPAITTQPQSTMINSGANATLTVAATGDPTMTYQWYTGASGNTSSPVAGGTAATLVVTPASTTSYWVRVTNGTGSAQTCGVNSTAATVTICAPPSITAGPNSPNITRGQLATIAVTATGNGLSYQWYQGAVGVTTSPFGTNAASQQVNPQVTTDYWVKVTGTCGTQNSTGAKVSVTPIFTTQPAAVRITKGTTATFSVNIDGSQLSYQWYAGTSGSGTAISGATSSSYTTPALNADATYWVRVTSGNAIANSNDATATICVSPSVSVNQQPNWLSGAPVTLSIVNPNGTDSYAWYRGNSGDTTTLLGSGTSWTQITQSPTQTTNYWVRTTGGGCYADSPTITVVICTPAITAQPQNVSVTQGNQATLSVTATGNATLTYQWYAGASGVTTSPVTTGGTAATLNITPSSTTSYWCRVTNGTGGCTANSNAATVTVCVPPSITTQPSTTSVITRGQSTSISVAATGSGLTYQWYTGASGVTTNPFGTNAASQSVNPQVTTDYWVKVTGTCGTPVNSTAGKISVNPIFNSQPQSVNITRGTTATFSVSIDGTQLSYQWYAGASGNTSTPVGTNSSSYTTPALVANATYWVKVTSGNAIAFSNDATATICTSPSVTYSQNSGQPSGGPVTLSIVNPNGTDTYAWYRGNSGDTSSFIGNTGTSGVLSQNPTQTTSYWVRTTSGSCYADSATVTVSICTPAITAQPQNTGVIAPNSTTLSVTATGNPTLTYQWYTGTSGNTASPISGATGSTVSVAPGSTTSYWVRVTNGTNGASCYVNSNTATVTVCNLPTINTQPGNTYVPQGWSSANVNINASGATTYQWFQGQPGDTSHSVYGPSSSSMATVYPGATNYYWCRVSNACGSRDSNACLVSVYAQINSAPPDVSLTPGSIATFTVNASGNYLHYQWVKDGANVGTDSPTLTLTAGTTSASIGCYITSGITQTAVWANMNICSGPTVTYGPAKSGTGSCRTVQVNVDDPYATYKWYVGARGDTSSPVPQSAYLSGYSIYVCPATSTTYWCRITSPDTSCYTDSAAITVP